MPPLSAVAERTRRWRAGAPWWSRRTLAAAAAAPPAAASRRRLGASAEAPALPVELFSTPVWKAKAGDVRDWLPNVSVHYGRRELLERRAAGGTPRAAPVAPSASLPTGALLSDDTASARPQRLLRG